MGITVSARLAAAGDPLVQRDDLEIRQLSGDEVGVLGGIEVAEKLAMAVQPLAIAISAPAPHPVSARRRAGSDLSPQAGRGDWARGQFFHTLGAGGAPRITVRERRVRVATVRPFHARWRMPTCGVLRISPPRAARWAPARLRALSPCFLRWWRSWS